jgi:hypothetical protein
MAAAERGFLGAGKQIERHCTTSIKIRIPENPIAAPHSQVLLLCVWQEYSLLMNGTIRIFLELTCCCLIPPSTSPSHWACRLKIWYTHKTSGFKTSGFKTSETSGLQNVRFTKCQVYKTSGLQNVWLQKNIHIQYTLYLWLVEIRRFCCSHVSRQSDSCVLFSILEVFLPYITIIASNKQKWYTLYCK